MLLDLLYRLRALLRRAYHTAGAAEPLVAYQAVHIVRAGGVHCRCAVVQVLLRVHAVEDVVNSVRNGVVALQVHPGGVGADLLGQLCDLRGVQRRGEEAHLPRK